MFLFFAGWIGIATLGVAFFLPETKGVPVESVPALFARHWAWKKVMGAPAADEVRCPAPCAVWQWACSLAGAASTRLPPSCPPACSLPLAHSLTPHPPPSTPPHPRCLQFIQAEEAKSCASVGSKLESGATY